MKFNVAYQQRHNRRLAFKEEPMGIDPAEPFGMHRFDFYEDRFSRLTGEAVEKDKISLGMGSRGREVMVTGTRSRDRFAGKGMEPENRTGIPEVHHKDADQTGSLGGHEGFGSGP